MVKRMKKGFPINIVVVVNRNIDFNINLNWACM